jgi:chorismate synthase
MNSFGRIFRVSVFGESHGITVGVLIDGCPAGLRITQDDFKNDLTRRMSGAPGTTSRRETDNPIIKSGVYKDFTTGAPILIEFDNNDIQSNEYLTYKITPRPGHADFTSLNKYKGFNDPRGSGHFSGRITLALVAAGVIAKKIISSVSIDAKLITVAGRDDIDQAIEEAYLDNNSVGGLIECQIKNIPIGIGEPFFDSIESTISHLIFSIPAIKGIEFGAGFKSSEMKGSEFNDMIIDNSGKTLTNNSGGINGGLSNGNDIIFRIAVKPASSIGKPQNTINLETKQIQTLQIEGRHDACIALRIPVIVEAAAAIAIADLFLINYSMSGAL